MTKVFCVSWIITVFYVIDIVAALTEQQNFNLARNYWKVLKHRLNQEGSELVTNCNQLRMVAEDGKMRLTDVADPETISCHRTCAKNR